MDGATDQATDGAMDKAMDRLIEIESTHYLLHCDYQVIRRSLIKSLFIGDRGCLRNMCCLESVYLHIISL